MISFSKHISYSKKKINVNNVCQSRVCFAWNIRCETTIVRTNFCESLRRIIEFLTDSDYNFDNNTFEITESIESPSDIP
jgi:hypothetical protein